MASASHPLSLRLGDEGWRALEDIARKRGLTRAEAARQAIAETAERERRRSGLAAEVARLADDPDDRAARGRVMADMDAIAADWPE
jgi:predicted transcriptional regulator